MGLDKRETITYNDKGFSATMHEFNNLIYLDWSNVKWKPKNIERYLLYVLEPVDSKKNIFDGAKPMIQRVVTEPYAMVKISNLREQSRLFNRNIGFFVGAIEKGKTSVSGKTSNWKQAKVKYIRSPNIWTKFVDGINLEQGSACSLKEFLANYKRSTGIGSIRDIAKRKDVLWGFFDETPEKRMTLDEAIAKLAESIVYVSGKNSVIMLPKTMRDFIDELMSQKDNQPSPRDNQQFIIDISKYKFLKNSESLKALKKNLSIKQFKNNNFLEVLFWRRIKFYKPNICTMLQIGWDYDVAPFSVDCCESDPPREVYKGYDKTCIDKYFDWNVYRVKGKEWQASFVVTSDGEPYPVGENQAAEMVDLR